MCRLLSLEIWSELSCGMPATFVAMLDEIVSMKPSSPRSSQRELVIQDWNADRELPP